MSDSLIMILSPFIIGLCVWALVFGGIFSYYRNQDKRYAFERETLVEVANAQGFDRRVGTRTGVQGSWMDGANSGYPQQRVQRITMGPPPSSGD